MKYYDYVIIVAIYLLGGFVANGNHDIDGWFTATFFFIAAGFYYFLRKKATK